ncbi:MAG: glycosyltransferase family 2 protein [Gammaproteobacteria bacterium]
MLLVGDGPRENRPGEAEKVSAARQIVDRVDWDCEVLTNFSDVNLGCNKRVSSGVDWIFDQVEEAIILEDDCLPDPSFFRFCQEMLSHFREDQRIGMIGGTNFQSGRRRGDSSYYFSRYSIIWGWASWRDRWRDSYDVNMESWPRVRDEGWLADMLGNRDEVRYWNNIFERVYRGEIDTWDYQWFYANWLQGRLSVMPALNLISNLGYGDAATHTTSEESPVANVALNEMTFPLTHPPGVFRSIEADRVTDQVFFRGTLGKRARQKLQRMLGRLLPW